MSASLDNSPPPWAATIWHDGQSLYLRLPDSGYITKFMFTEAALSKALKLIRAKTEAPNGYTVKQPEPKTLRRKPFKPSEGLRTSLQDAVRKLK